MNFPQTLEEDQLFADMFNIKEPMGDFDLKSEDSLFDQMVDNIMSDKASKYAVQDQHVHQNEPNLQ